MPGGGESARRVRALGTTGLRGRLESGPGRDLAFISWRPDCLEDPAPGVPLDVQFRLRRGRDGAPEAEIVAARPLLAFEASSAAVPA